MAEGGPAPNLRPTADGFPTLYSARYGQTYHSHHGARREAEHVFLDATGVAARLAAAEATRVLEVGYGAGLTFWLTAARAAATGAPLAYTALEHDLPPERVLRATGYGTRLGLGALEAELLAWRAHLPATGAHRLCLGPRLTLTLVLGDARAAPLPDRAFDAVYLDAFSPDANPELWTEAFFERLHAALAPGGVLATYSAKGTVRRALIRAGFAVEKRPGPPGKREMLRAARR